MFVATLSYELDAATSPDARKLLRAELVGRRYNDRFQGKSMPAGCLWIGRNAEPGETVDDLMEKSKKELHAAVAAVARTGLAIRLVRAWVHVTGAGTFGLIDGLAPTGEDPGEKV